MGWGGGVLPREYEAPPKGAPVRHGFPGSRAAGPMGIRRRLQEPDSDERRSRALRPALAAAPTPEAAAFSVRFESVRLERDDGRAKGLHRPAELAGAKKRARRKDLHWGGAVEKEGSHRRRSPPAAGSRAGSFHGGIDEEDDPRPPRCGRRDAPPVATGRRETRCRRPGNRDSW